MSVGILPGLPGIKICALAQDRPRAVRGLVLHRPGRAGEGGSLYGGSLTPLACGTASRQLSWRSMLALKRSVVRSTAQNHFRLVAIEKRSAWPNTLVEIQNTLVKHVQGHWLGRACLLFTIAWTLSSRSSLSVCLRDSADMHLRRSCV